MSTEHGQVEVGDAEVVHTWLLSELRSDGASASYVQRALDSCGFGVEVITSAPDFSDADANARRSEVLRRARWGILSDLPPAAKWIRLNLPVSEVQALRYLGGGGMETWQRLAGPGLNVGRAAHRAAAHDHSQGDVEVDQLVAELHASARRFAAGGDAPPIIVVAQSTDSPERVIIDGCHRATGFSLAMPKSASLPAFVAITPEIQQWGRWKPLVG